MKKRWITSILCAVSGLLALPLHATTGPGHTGLIAKADNAVNANLNPAGLTRIEKPEWVGQVLYFDSESEFAYSSDQSSQTFREFNDSTTIIPFIYYARPLNEKWGLGVFVTGNAFGEDLDDDGPSRYQVTEWDLITGSLVANLGYRINDSWSIGGGISANYTNFNLKSAVFNPEPNIGDGEMEYDDADITLSWALGALYEFTDATRVGLTYRSESDPELSDKPSFRGLGPIRQAILDLPNSPLSQTIGLGINMPQMFLGGVYHEFDSNNSVSFDAGWIDFSEFGISDISIGDNSLNVTDSNFEDIWLGSLGYEHRFNKKWKAGIGAAYVSSALKDENRTYAFKLDDIWVLGVGGEYSYNDNLIFGLNLNFYEFGDGKTEVNIAEPEQTLRGKYVDRDIIGLDFTIRWIR